MDVPTDTFLVGYTDVITAVIFTKNTEDAQRGLNQAMRCVSSWFEERCPDLVTKENRNCIAYQIVPYDN